MTWLKPALVALLVGLCLGWMVRGGGTPVVIPPALQVQVDQALASHLPDTLTKVVAELDRGQQARAVGKDSVAAVVAAIDPQGSCEVCLGNLRKALGAASWYSERWINAEGQLSQARDYLVAARDTLVEDRRIVAALVAVIHDARTPKVLHWAAGPVFELGRLVPVGGSLDRDLGPLRIRLEVTDGPNEPATARLGLALKF